MFSALFKTSKRFLATKIAPKIGPVVAAALLTGCATSDFSKSEFLDLPQPAGPPERDWAAGYFKRDSFEAGDDERWQTISYVHSGAPDGRRVIFIHGSPGFAGDWLYPLAFQVPGLHMIAVDRPGFGFSAPHRAMPSLAEQAKRLAPLVSTETLNGAAAGSSEQKPILVGWSYGAPLAVQLAADYPDRVAGLVLVAGALDPALEKVRFIQRVGDLAPFRYFVKDTWRIANDELIPLKKELEKLAPKLGHITVPVTIIHGGQDDLVPVANVNYMQARLSASTRLRVEIIPGSNHNIPGRHPDVILNAVMSQVGLACRFEINKTENGDGTLTGTCPDGPLEPIGTLAEKDEDR